jgi:formylglycine-generating enzyme required for sulfatase activity
VSFLCLQSLYPFHANSFSHLLNNGVEETPPSREAESVEGSLELFTDLEGANVGFKHWHPVAVTAYGNKLAGQGEMGGVWEWTSTTLEKHKGFEPIPLYPGYTGITRISNCDFVITNMPIADFFDGKHNIVLGGSWATHPRIAGRKTL